MRTRILLAAVAALAFVSTAQAQPNNFPEPVAQEVAALHPAHRVRVTSGRRPLSVRIVGRRPPGCPHRYCGCGLSLKLFGRIIPKLNLAWNWARTFPRSASPRPGMVAVRRGHVMQLLAHVGGRQWRVYDPNSGGGLTRIHVQSVAGYLFVDPSASRLAQAGAR